MLVFDGRILGAAFSSGDRVVVGRWHGSPFGGFTDIMWARPDGTRVLIADHAGARAFIRRHYDFDEEIDAPVDVVQRGQSVRVEGGPVSVAMELRDGGAADLLLRLRPGWFRRRPGWLSFEDRFLRPVLSPFLGDLARVRVTGRTRAGTREWYSPMGFRAARDVHATIDGHDPGPLDPRPAPAGFGFSEFPSRAGVVRVVSLFDA